MNAGFGRGAGPSRGPGLTSDRHLANEAALIGALHQIGRELHDQAAPCVSWLPSNRLAAIVASFGLTTTDIDRTAIEDADWVDEQIGQGVVLAMLGLGQVVTVDSLLLIASGANGCAGRLWSSRLRR